MRLNLDYLVEKLWEHLNLIKVFTKKRGRNTDWFIYKGLYFNLIFNIDFFIQLEKPDLVDGIILRNGATVEAVVSFILPIIWLSQIAWKIDFYLNKVSFYSSYYGRLVSICAHLGIVYIFTMIITWKIRENNHNFLR